MSFLAALAAFADRKLLYPAVYPSRVARGGSVKPAKSQDSRASRPSRVFAPMPMLPGDLFSSPALPAFEHRAHVLRFESPAWPVIEAVSDAILQHKRNRVVTVALSGPIAGRSSVVGLPGDLGGHPRTDRVSLGASRFMRANHVFAHYTLPFHGARAEKKGRPFFPHADPRITFEALRQGALEAVALVQLLRTLGAARVTLAGLSLGAYIAALAATIVPRRDGHPAGRLDGLDGLVLLTPLASFRSLDAPPAGDARDLVTLTRAATRSPQIAGEHVLVIGAREDLITPLPHARSLADHFRGELATIAGGHLLPFGRDEALDRWLAAR